MKALAEQEKPLYRKVLREMLDAHEQAEQEPVAWATSLKDWRSVAFSDKPFEGATPLYAAPVRTKDLTDDEIETAKHCLPRYLAEITDEDLNEFARAVIAADREKNK